MFGGGFKGKIDEFTMKQAMKRQANKIKKATIKLNKAVASLSAKPKKANTNKVVEISGLRATAIK